MFVGFVQETDAQGHIQRQHLRVILGQKSKERMAKKQEEAERMMHGGPGSSVGWQGQDMPGQFPPHAFEAAKVSKVFKFIFDNIFRICGFSCFFFFEQKFLVFFVFTNMPLLFFLFP